MFILVYKDLDDFEFEIDIYDLKRAILSFPEGQQQLIHIEEDASEYDHEYESLKELVNFFKDELLDYFREDAKEQYRDYLLLKNDPYSFYGVSKKDFY